MPILVEYSLHWPDPTKIQNFTIEALTAENTQLLKGQIPDADLANADFFVSRHPDYGLTILEGDPRTVVFFSPIEMFRRYWACPKYRHRLIAWTPVSPLFRLW